MAWCQMATAPLTGIAPALWLLDLQRQTPVVLHAGPSREEGITPLFQSMKESQVSGASRPTSESNWGLCHEMAIEMTSHARDDASSSHEF